MKRVRTRFYRLRIILCFLDKYCMKYSWRAYTRSILVSVLAMVHSLPSPCFSPIQVLPFYQLIHVQQQGSSHYQSPSVFSPESGGKKHLNRERWRVLVQRERGFLSTTTDANHQERNDGLSIRFAHMLLNRKCFRKKYR